MVGASSRREVAAGPVMWRQAYAVGSLEPSRPTAPTPETTVRLEIVTTAAAPRAAVWRVLTTWERQPEWMLDAKAVEVLTPHREGEGVTIRCPTLLLGVTVDDIMRVTGWREEEYLEVTHLGKVITGTGAFELRDVDGGTQITWWEQIDPPLGRVGAWGARTVVLPIIERIFRRSLRNLARLSETPPR